MQKRVLLFVHDGSGLGHLRRMARIAAGIQGPCAALVVTGMREAAWMVAPDCEVLCLPSWDGVRPSRARALGRRLWLDVTHDEAGRIRRELLHAAFRVFAPDAVFVDYLPFGHFEELRWVLAESSARKFFVLRGIVDTSDHWFLQGDAARILGSTFHRILVAADARIVDVVAECELDQATAAKVLYVGYVAPGQVDRVAVRRNRGVADDKPWVVISAGGGRRAEEFLRYCIDVAASMRNAEFDVIFGPRGNATLIGRVSSSQNCRISKERKDLAELHAAADVVVTSGGYNSLLEAATGGARIIVRPSRSGDDDEQYVNASRLAHYYPITVLDADGALRVALTAAISSALNAPRPSFSLYIDGIDRIRDTLLKDLSLL
jgi:predicted glycosyltransferase